jgi:hypothetical protein
MEKKKRFFNKIIDEFIDCGQIGFYNAIGNENFFFACLQLILIILQINCQKINEHENHYEIHFKIVVGYKYFQ